MMGKMHITPDRSYLTTPFQPQQESTLKKYLSYTLKILLGYSLTHETNFQFSLAKIFIRVGELSQLFICYY